MPCSRRIRGRHLTPIAVAGLTRGEVLRRLRSSFIEAGIDNPGLDARLLTAAVLGLDDVALIAHPSVPLDGDQADRLNAYAIRRMKREPVARIVGQKEFWSIAFEVSDDTLIPRPDTEILVELVLSHVRDRAAPLRVLDLGTGSGCILIALMRELPNATGLGIDCSADAVATAARNAARAGIGDRIRFQTGHWAIGLNGPFDVIASNPPYIPTNIISTLEPDVQKYDPMKALDGGEDGLSAYRTILSQVPAILAQQGLTAFEIGQGQGDDLIRIASDWGFYEMERRRDLSGIERALAFRRK